MKKKINFLFFLLFSFCLGNDLTIRDSYNNLFKNHNEHIHPTTHITNLIRKGTNGLTQTSEVISGSSYLVSNDIRLHFGLGDVDVVEEVNIRWPDGSEQILNNIPARQILTLEQPENLE